MKNKHILLIVALILAVGGTVWLVSAHKAPAPEVTKVRMASLPNAQGLPIYLAINKGYFKDAGLDVEVIRFETPNQIIDALLQGNVDFSHTGGATGIAGIADFKNPGKLKIYALAGGDSTTIQSDALLVRTGSPIKSIADLKGKKLSIMAGTIQWQTIVRELLARNGLVYDKDVKIVEVALGLQVQALAAGDIDATLIIEPIPTIVKAKGIGTELVPFAAAKYIADPIYTGAGILRTDFAKQNPNTAKKVLDVITRAVDEINQNPDAARQYLKGYTQLDDTTIAKVPVMHFKMYNELSDADIVAGQKFYDIFTKWGVVSGTMDFKKLLYTDK